MLPPKLERFGKLLTAIIHNVKLQIEKECFLLSAIHFGYFLIVGKEKN